VYFSSATSDMIRHLRYDTLIQQNKFCWISVSYLRWRS